MLEILGALLSHPFTLFLIIGAVAGLIVLSLYEGEAQ